MLFRLRLLVCAACALVSARAHADGEYLLRMGTMAPAGTAWARELNAFARDVAAQTNGAVRVKWYFGGIAGDEVQMGQRLRKGQLDGAASGGPLCENLAPSMRVLRVVGLLTTQHEAGYVAGRLWPIFEREFAQHGYVGLGTSAIGPHILFSRAPIRSMADLRRGAYWVWDRDDVLRAELASFGVKLVPLPLDQAARAYEERRVDGFLAPASVALAFQWSAHARYVTDLRLDYITGCVVVSDRAFDPLPVAARAAVRSAAGKLAVRFAEVNAETDQALLGGLFAHQGINTIPVDPSFSAEFFELARATRDRLDDKLISRPLLTRVLGILADYRAAAE